MFDFVRSHNRLLQVVLGLLIIPSFVFFGIEGYSSFQGDEAAAVASVDGQDISRTEWEARHRQYIERERERRPGVDLKALDTPQARREALESLIRDRVLLAAAADQNLNASDARVNAVLQKSPEFEQLRQMDPAQRNQALASQGLTQDTFFERLRSGLTQSQPLRAVELSVIAPSVSVKAGLDAFFNKRVIQWQHFDVKAYAAALQPTDAQVQAYYSDKSRAMEFMVPEQAKIEYIVLDPEAVKAQTTISAAEVEKYYEANKQRFTVPEERRSSHILMTVDPKASAAERAKAKARAEEVLAEVRKKPSDFAELARKHSQDAGSAPQGGDLDFMGREAMKGAFADKLFAMKPDEISDVVQSDFGYHIIRLTGVRGGALKPLAEVRPQLEDELRMQLAQQRYASVAEQFTNLVYEAPESLQPVVDKLKLTKQTAVVGRKPAPDATGPLASQRLLDAVFGSETLSAKHNTEAIETAGSQLVSARVLEHQPQRMRPLAEVREQVVARVRDQLAAAAARREGEARLAVARKDAALALPLAATVGRTAPAGEVPSTVVDAALKADLAKGPVVSGLTLPDGGYAVIRVMKDVPRAANDAESERAEPAVERSIGDAEANAVYEALKARYKTKIDEDRLARFSDAGASAPR